ncbi:carboxylic acid reductase [Streptomyces paludis]|uniref:Carboxylic acid reductase n=1 Tax=Streptomyces paludis TaxID=2282738 RepID=A0A345I2A9_9ACTN|nr:carboxylic acid reductase [Streptomyces paludis]AXG83083.1 NAD-dependent epimerase/dehydratase family protein [Streptomyces paludis]
MAGKHNGTHNENHNGTHDGKHEPTGPAPGRGLADVLASVDPGEALAEVMAAIFENHGDRPALGERAVCPTTGRLLPRFDTVTYRELWARVRAVASLWHHAPEYALSPGDRLGTLGFTGIDYATLDLACIHAGVVPVPLQSSAPLSRLRPVVAETEPRVLAASSEYLATAVDLALETPSIQRLIVFDHRPGTTDHRPGTTGRHDALAAARRRLDEAGSPVVLDTLSDMIERGGRLPPAPLFTAGPGEDPLSLLIYTSGSTGAPKGAMYTQRLVGTAWYGFSYGPADTPPVSVLYMPHSHLAGRYALMGSLVKGGVGHFTARSDLSTLFEDIALVRPTELTMVPRICDMLFERYRGEVDRRAGEPGDIGAAVREDLRENVLGGRVAKAFVGTAPLSAETASFVESCLGCHLYTGYGSTEAGGVLLDTVVQRPPVTDYKLVDVPQLGYYGTDVPYPRGELLLKSETLVPGYYKRPELTAALFDEDGYYRTGDVFAELGPDRLVYVDRTKDTLKLSQGEFVAVSRLETVFLGSPLVRQIYVYGNSERAYLLAVVVPTPDATAACGDDPARLKPLIAASLRHLAKEAGLSPYEIPRDFLIETEPFSTGNGLYTESHKLPRVRLKERYGDALERRYDELAGRQDRQLHALRRTGPGRPVAETVGRAAQALLGLPAADLSTDAHFTDLGGDSLSALAFSRLLQEIFHTDVPVAVIISPANDLARVAEHIETQRHTATERATFATVHGAHSTEVRAADLTLDKFLDTATLVGAPALPRPDGPPRTVLLTGANGYLGRFLCLEWLGRLAATGGRLICLVRGGDTDAATARLEESFGKGDDELLRRYRELAEGTLDVRAGDLGEPRLGLTEAAWDELARTVDMIVHPAALVNHVLPYSQLFGPNVAGTAEVIRLALTARLKPVTYVSTVAVHLGTGAAAPDEDADIRGISPVRTVDQGYASGYATSKWAGEVLLREAHERCGLPVAVFRSNNVLAHSGWHGQLNVPDVFTRLLLSVLATGLAPGSFYRGKGARAHYDGLPADFTAEAITSLGARATTGHRTFNVVNPHDDGISLDTFVDWLIEAGHPVRRIDGYDAWLTRFTVALRALPERQRRLSLLPLLHAFARPEEEVSGSALPAERFRAAVRARETGSGEDIPRLSAALIRKYVTDLRQLGLLL